MLPDHILLKLQTGRDCQQTPEAMAQVFAALPALRNQWCHRLRKRAETISFEIAVRDQVTAFYVCAPVRFSAYMRGILSAAYPEALITKATDDPVGDIHRPFNAVPSSLLVASIRLRANERFPLKTYRDYPETDSLALLLAALAKAGPRDLVVLQYLVDRDRQPWQRTLLTGMAAQIFGDRLTAVHPQQALIDRKERALGVRVHLRLALHTPTSGDGQRLLEGLSSALQGFALQESNALLVHRTRLFPGRLAHAMLSRSPAATPSGRLSVDELAALCHLPNQQLATIRGIAWGKQLAGEPPEALPIVKPPGQRVIDPEIVPIARTRYKNREVAYGIRRVDRRRHVYIVGKTGTGKSTLLANMAIHDIRHGEGICVVDPHGDLVETLLDYIPRRRINDVIYFDPSDPERVVKINPFEDVSATHRELIASGIVSVFHKLYGESWGPRLEYILRNALLSLLHHPTPRLSDVLTLLTSPDFRSHLVKRLDDPVLKRFWLDEYETMPDRLRAEAISPILNKVGQFVTSRLVRDVINTPRSSFSIERAMNEGKVILVNLSQGKLGEDNATLLGAMLITKIQLATMSRVHMPEEKRRDFFLYVDEFQNFATDSFAKMLSEARKYRLNLTLANQYVAQIPERTRKAIFGNCGSLVSFVVGAEDASVLTRELGDQYSENDLTSLGHFQVVNRLMVGDTTCLPFPARTLPLDGAPTQRRARVIGVSRERYAAIRDA